MVETTTKNYGWIKPQIQGSPETWGGFLNNDLDEIDALVFANQNSGVPIGSITMFAGSAASVPANWLLCDGTVYLNTDIPLLAPILNNQYPGGAAGVSNAVPDLTQGFVIGVGVGEAVGATGGAWNYTLDTAHMPPHAHPIVDVAHNHVLNQSPHGHGDPGHTHTITDPGHAHSLNVGGTASGTNFQAGSGFTPAGTTTNAAVTGIHGTNAAGTGIQAANANLSLNASGTGLSTTQNTGGGASFEVVPPYITLGFIIRYQ
jgi:microcystin-dependent protein